MALLSQPAGRISGRHISDFWLLLPLLAAALALRLYGLNWDNGHLFHPDERHILMTTQNLALNFPLDWNLLLSEKSPLNPHFFAYGSFPFYLLKLTTHSLASLGWWLPPLEGMRTFSDFDHLRTIGRVVSALFDTGSIVLVFILGRKLYGRSVGLLAAALLSFSVLNVQLSHFFASDTIVTFFLLASTLAALNLAEKGTWRSALLLGLCVGLALATKASASPIGAAVAVALFLRLMARRHEDYSLALASKGNGAVVVQMVPREVAGFELRMPSSAEVNRVMALGLVTAITIGAVFLATQPYVIIDFTTFARNMAEQSGMVRGVNDLPYTRQYANTLPYWYFIQNLLAWGLGWLPGLAAVAGTLAVVWRAIRRPLPGELVIMAWTVPYFLITGAFHAKFLRYMLPFVPFMCLFGAYGLMALWGRLRRQTTILATVVALVGEKAGPDVNSEAALLPGSADDRGVPPSPRKELDTLWQRIIARGWAEKAAAALIGAVLLYAVLYSLAFVRIYSQEHPGIQISRWIYAHVPDGAKLGREHWEEGLPVHVSAPPITHSAESHRYQIIELRMYENDDARKLEHIIQSVQSADYIIFFSNRLYGTIPRLPSRYPLTTRYYQMLFSGELGYELAAYGASYPNILGVTLVDDTFSAPRLPVPEPLAEYHPSPIVINNGRADESFTVYDHPKTMVFRKVRQLSRQELEALFTGALPAPSSTIGQAAFQGEGLLLPTSRMEVMEAGGTYDELFPATSFANQFPWLIWILIVEALGLLAFPVAYVAFRFLPDRGYLLAKGLGLLIVTWASWVVVSLTPIPANRFTVIGAVIAMAALSGYLAHRYSTSIQLYWRDQKRAVLLGEAVFWGAFLFFLAIRLANPDLWHPARGGEKPMDLAYLMAAIKSVDYPPYDPWFAGGYLNYYYFGQIIVATLVKLSGVAPVMAYNLVVPTLFACTAGGAFSLAYNLSPQPDAGPDARVRVPWWRPALAGGIAAVMTVLIGNLATVGQIVEQLWRNAGQVDLKSSLPLLEGGARAMIGLGATLFQGKPFPVPADWYWASSRVYTGAAVVNEFPYFTFLYADLHAHMIAFPFALLALAVGVNALKGGKDETPPVDGLSWKERLRTSLTRGRMLRAGVAALAIGMLYPTNSWDFPTYLAAFGLCLLIARYVARRGRPLTPIWEFLAPVLIELGAVAALSYLLYYPFHMWFKSFYFGLDPSPERSEPLRYLAIHGLFLFILLTYIGLELGRIWWRSGPVRLARLVLWRWERLPRLAALYPRLVHRRSDRAALVMYSALAGLILMAGLWVAGFSLVGLLLALLAPVLALLLRREGPAEQKLVLGLLAIGLTIGIFCEVFAIKGDIGRMNTVFKFYLQVWLMWSVAAGVVAFSVWERVSSWRSKAWRQAWQSVLILLVVVSFIYPAIATRARVNDRFEANIPPTLDGTAYAGYATYYDQNKPMDIAGDMAAIRWMQKNIAGSPVVLEATIPVYRWGSRFSIYTGLPAVLGWDWHQKQQRWGYQWMIDQRLNDVRQMYVEPSPERVIPLLEKYRVRYIVVGEVERAYYPGAGLDKFDHMVGKQLELVYNQGTVKIYAVREKS